MVELHERPEADAYYPESVAISSTASAETVVVASSEYKVVAGNSWELGLQIAFLDPAPEPAPELEPAPERSDSSREGVQLELPCPVVAVNGVCESEERHHWAKECICNREWCWDIEGRCGGNGGAAHQRRKARWLPKAYKIGGMGGFVLSLPPEVRDRYRTQGSLGDLGTAARRMMQRHGYKRGLRRWHFFGEDHRDCDHVDSPKYHPHLEVLVDGGYLQEDQLQAIKRSWANILKVPVSRINIHYKYVQPHDTRRKLHRISYALRPTFTDWRWDEELAYNLIGFHNAQTWGSTADWAGPDLWEVDPKEDSAAAAISLESGFCPSHGKYANIPIHWGGLINIRTLVEPFWEPVGAGYWRWTGVGDLPKARDGPGRGDG